MTVAAATGYDAGLWSSLLGAVHDCLSNMPEIAPSPAPFSARRLPATLTGRTKRSFCLALVASEDTGRERQRARSSDGHTLEVRLLSKIGQSGSWLADHAALLDACQAVRDALLDKGDATTDPPRISPLAGWQPRWKSVEHEEVGEFVVSTITLLVMGTSFPADRPTIGLPGAA